MRKKIPAEILELIRDLRNYAQNLSHWILEAEASVREWIPANELMVQFHPLRKEALTPGSDRWYTTQAGWRRKDDAGSEYHHGFDDQGRIRLVRFDTQLRQVYVYRDEVVDELRLQSSKHLGAR